MEHSLLQPLTAAIDRLLHETNFLSVWPPQLTYLILLLQRQLKLNLLQSKHFPLLHVL